MKKYIFLLLISVGYKIESFTYINGKDISLRTIVTGACYMPIDYNILNSGDGHLSEYKRYFGIHNMSITIPGYEKIDLIKDDVCFYPSLFTLLASVLPKNSFITQRWACVKYFLPLSFGFKVKNNELIVSSSIFRYAILAPFLTKENIPLVLSKNDEKILDGGNKITFTVSVNGRTVVVSEEEVVQIFSQSGQFVVGIVINTAPFMIAVASTLVAAYYLCVH
ncbi:hypothetical protein HYV11_03175 [Candidatus Dependentiae bacterium]|nr:hypothetical protein [Candidatus Dependentiae bacterium]